MSDTVTNKPVMFLRNLLIALGLLFLGTGFAPGQVSAEILWEEQPQFQVEMNGKLDISGKVYRPTDNQPLLIFISDATKKPLLIDLSKKTVKEISEKSLNARDEYSYTSSNVPSGKKVGTYKLSGGASTFKYNGNKVSISVKQSLIGEVPESVILAHSPVYGALRDAYKPKSKYVSTIKNYGHDIHVVVMFATWCPTCKQVLPRFMSVMDAANNKKFSVKYIGIGMGGTEPHAELEKYGHDYPAFIFYKNGKEMDRIIGEPNVSMEQSIAEILTRG